MSTDIKKEVLRLIKEDEEFRYTLIGAIGIRELLERLDKNEKELVRLRRDFNRMRRETRQEIALLRQEIASIREEHKQETKALRNEFGQEVASLKQEVASLKQEVASVKEEMRRGFERLERRMTALGARWGVDSEEAFREAMRGILGEELGAKVDRWVAQDNGGVVYGYPSAVEIDLAITDGKTLLIEVSSYVRKTDVFLFLKKAKFYEERTGRRPEKLIVVSPFVDDEAAEACKQLGVEVYTKT